MAVEKERIDPRIRRTRRLLIEALVELCGQKDYRSISVTDITRVAEVNRATFYLHFEDKDDLLDRGFEMFLEDLGAGFLEPRTGMDDETWIRYRMLSLFEMIAHRRHLFLAILSGVGASPLFEKTAAFLERFLMENRFPSLKPDGEGDPVPPQLLAGAIVSTLVGFASHWIRDDCRIAAADMAGYYIRFLRGAVTAAGYR